MIEYLIFGILALLTLVPALLVVSVKNVFHAALFLVTSLLGVAGIYAMLAADFLFAVQLLVYIGGVMIILLFVVLLSGKPSDWTGRQVNEKSWAAGLFSIFFVTAMLGFICKWSVPIKMLEPQATTGKLGDLLIKQMVLPFEVISLVMVVALIGAIFFSSKKAS
ncbi:MAG: NADH-quinone oxidoreductase subunit J [Elusimicrobiota bacterium]